MKEEKERCRANSKVTGRVLPRKLTHHSSHSRSLFLTIRLDGDYVVLKKKKEVESAQTHTSAAQDIHMHTPGGTVYGEDFDGR